MVILPMGQTEECHRVPRSTSGTSSSNKFKRTYQFIGHATEIFRRQNYPQINSTDTSNVSLIHKETGSLTANDPYDAVNQRTKLQAFLHPQGRQMHAAERTCTRSPRGGIWRQTCTPAGRCRLTVLLRERAELRILPHPLMQNYISHHEASMQAALGNEMNVNCEYCLCYPHQTVSGVDSGNFLFQVVKRSIMRWYINSTRLRHVESGFRFRFFNLRVQGFSVIIDFFLSGMRKPILIYGKSIFIHKNMF